MFSPLMLNKKNKLFLSPADRYKNILITGQLGMGVTTYLQNLILQDIANNQPCIVLDPYGDLSNAIKKDNEKASDTIEHIDIFDPRNKKGLNIFHASKQFEKNEVVSTIMNILYDLYDPQRTGVIGPRLEHAVRNAVLTIFYDDTPTFDSLIRCLTDMEYVNSLMPKIKESYVKDYWNKQVKNTSDFHKSEVLDYILSKFSPFVSDTRIRTIVNQKTSLDFEEYAKNKNSLVFDFGTYYYDNNLLNVVSTLLSHLLLQYVRSRPKDSQPMTLYISEIELFNSQSLHKLYMHSNRLGISIVATTSRLSSLSDTLRNELIRSGTLISFNTHPIDSTHLKLICKKDIITHISNLKPYQAVVTTYNDGNPMPPYTIDLHDKQKPQR